jgi:hypothetical protein
MKAFSNGNLRARCPSRQGKLAAFRMNRRGLFAAGVVAIPQLVASDAALAEDGGVSFLPTSQMSKLSAYQRNVMEYNQRIQKQNNAPPGFPAFIRDKFDITIVGEGYEVSPDGTCLYLLVGLDLGLALLPFESPHGVSSWHPGLSSWHTAFQRPALNHHLNQA